MSKIVNPTFIIFLAICGLIAGGAYAGLPATREEGFGFTLVMAVLTVLTQLGAIWYFLSSLKTFKTALRVAYYFLSIGILFFSFIQAQILISLFVLITTSLVVSNLLIITPYVLSALCMYIAMRVFASLLHVRDIWTSPLVALGFSLLVAGAFVVVPHANLGVDESTLNLIMGSIAGCGALSIMALAVALRIRQAIGPVYKNAITWIILALGAVAFTAFHEIITKIYFYDLTYVINNLSVWPFLLVGLLLLRAGIAFKETGRSFVRLSAHPTYIEVITGTAQLASKPAAIDAELDKVRRLTAQHEPGKDLSPAEKDVLLGVYEHIEHHLTTEESLHTFTEQGLRNNLPADFVRDLEARHSPAAKLAQ
jgi:hypothetical protein